jgi:hypothetical protein
MDAFSGVNWLAVLVGTVAAFALGMLWFGPLFGRVWAAGSHGITRPASPPLAALSLQLLGTFLLALVIGITAVIDALILALLAILALAVLQLAGGLFGQKSPAASLIEGGYALAMGAVMILAQGLF